MDYDSTSPSFSTPQPEPPDEQPTPPAGTRAAERARDRSGRARERVARRRAQAHATPTGGATAGRRPPPQLAPAGSIRLPALPAAPLLHGLLIPGALAGALGLFLLVLYIMYRVTGTVDTPVTPPNALWLGTEYSYSLDPERYSLDALVERLREHRIGHVYAWVSWYKPDGVWGGRRDGRNEFAEVETTVRAFVEAFNALYPEAELYGWVSLPVGEPPNGWQMSDPAVQQAVADFSVRAVNEFGFDGVFLNIEPVWNNDADFLTLLGRVRAAVGPDVFISAAIPPDWSPIGAGIPVPPLIAPGTIWDDSYKQSVGLLVNELAVMAYNGGLTTPDEYSQWVAYQVRTYANAVAALDTGAGAGTRVMIGVPTYDAEPPGHDPFVENIPSAVAGIRLGLEQAGDAARYVHGAAIYAEWVTDETEWAQFMINWVEPRIR